MLRNSYSNGWLKVIERFRLLKERKDAKRVDNWTLPGMLSVPYCLFDGGSSSLSCPHLAYLSADSITRALLQIPVA